MLRTVLRGGMDPNPSQAGHSLGSPLTDCVLPPLEYLLLTKSSLLEKFLITLQMSLAHCNFLLLF